MIVACAQCGKFVDKLHVYRVPDEGVVIDAYCHGSKDSMQFTDQFMADNQWFMDAVNSNRAVGYAFQHERPQGEDA